MLHKTKLEMKDMFEQIDADRRVTALVISALC